MNKLLVGCAALIAAVSTANAQTDQSFVSSFTSSTLRNNYSGYVGMQFTVGAAPVTVTALGRITNYGRQVHTVKLVNAQTGADLAGGVVQINLTGSNSANVFTYAPLNAPIVLQANTTYRLLTQETTVPSGNGFNPDSWYDVTPVVASSVATVTGAVYTDASGAQIVLPGSAGESYGPVSFLYGSANPVYPPPTVTILNSPGLSTPAGFYATATAALGTILNVQFTLNSQNYGAPATTYNNISYQTTVLANSLLNDVTYTLTAVATDSFGISATSAPVVFTYAGTDQLFLSAQTLGAIRNDYGNQYGHFVGMEFTVGSQPLNVYELARYVAPGNTQSHIVKLVNAATGADVSGGSVTISLAGVPAGQYAYGYFSSPVVLAANTSYYLFSQEMAGGDKWYDVAPVTPNAALGTVNGGAYQDYSGVFQVLKNNTNYSYGPVNLGAAPIPGPYGITVYDDPLTNPYYSGVFLENVTVTPSNQVPLVSIQLQVDGKLVGTPGLLPPSGGAPYQVSFDTTQLSNGPHALAAVATDAAGYVGVSASQIITINNSTVIPISQPFVTSFQGTFLRNNYSGFVGFEFFTGPEPVVITSLGRYCAAGNSHPHTLKMVIPGTTPADVPGGSVSISMAGCTPGQFVYASLPSTLTLSINSYYYLASLETNGGDSWYDYSPIVTTSLGTSASVFSAVYFDGGSWRSTLPPAYNPFSQVIPASTSFVPLNFLFSRVNGNATLSVTAALAGNVVTAAPLSSAKILGVQFQIDGNNIYSPVTTAPYTLTVPGLSYGSHQITAVANDSLGNTAAASVTAFVLCNPCFYAFANQFGPSPVDLIRFTGTTLRNNYTGWVGFQFTGPFGGIIQTFSGGPSPIKFVDAATGLDVPGGTFWDDHGLIPLNGLNLQSGKSYYLLKQVTAGGPTWFDISPATAAGYNQPEVVPMISPGFVSIDGPVYTNGSSYVLVPAPNSMYVGFGSFVFTSPL